VLRLGFLDGIPGLQVCMYTAFYSFMKQAKLWESAHAVPQPDPEAEPLVATDAASATIDFARAQRSREESSAAEKRLRRAA